MSIWQQAANRTYAIYIFFSYLDIKQFTVLRCLMRELLLQRAFELLLYV